MLFIIIYFSIFFFIFFFQNLIYIYYNFIVYNLDFFCNYFFHYNDIETLVREAYISDCISQTSKILNLNRHNVSVVNDDFSFFDLNKKRIIYYLLINYTGMPSIYIPR